MMTLKIFSVLFVFSGLQFSDAYFFETCTSASSVSANKTVKTQDGAVNGACYTVPVSHSDGSTLSQDVFTWLSIPYAQPPIDNLRFMPAIPVNPWTESRDALKWPNACVQAGSIKGSEDCLYLNIFAPKSAYLSAPKTPKTPVLVYIHGGGFTQNSSADDLWEPSTLVAASDIIVVSINYRLNVFGFLHLAGSAATGNAGFSDQVLALKWVHENIDRFGGDKDKITISGESAGAFSVGYHMFYPPSWEYFRNGIMESGGPVGENNGYQLLSSEAVTASSKLLFDELGCIRPYSSQALECAQKKPSEEVLAALTKLSFRVTFRLVQDNLMFNRSIDELAAQGSFKRCSIITGFNSNEYGYFLATTGQMSLAQAKSLSYDQLRANLNYLWLPKPATPTLVEEILEEYRVENTARQTFVDYLIHIQSDVLFVCQAISMADRFASVGMSVYLYKYEYRISSAPWDPVYGVAVHTDDLAVVFAEALSNKSPPLLSQNPYSASTNVYSSETKRFTETMVAYWTNFIKYDDPNYSKNRSDGQFWQPSTSTDSLVTTKYLHITNEQIYSTVNLTDHRCAFWNYTLSGNSAYRAVYSVWSFGLIGMAMLASVFNL